MKDQNALDFDLTNNNNPQVSSIIQAIKSSYEQLSEVIKFIN